MSKSGHNRVSNNNNKHHYKFERECKRNIGVSMYLEQGVPSPPE
jgi:hypothetical protein